MYIGPKLFLVYLRSKLVCYKRNEGGQKFHDVIYGRPLICLRFERFSYEGVHEIHFFSIQFPVENLRSKFNQAFFSFSVIFPSNLKFTLTIFLHHHPRRRSSHISQKHLDEQFLCGKQPPGLNPIRLT